MSQSLSLNSLLSSTQSEETKHMSLPGSSTQYLSFHLLDPSLLSLSSQPFIMISLSSTDPSPWLCFLNVCSKVSTDPLQSM